MGMLISAKCQSMTFLAAKGAVSSSLETISYFDVISWTYVIFILP